jgi:hypothetical protein
MAVRTDCSSRARLFTVLSGGLFFGGVLFGGSGLVWGSQTRPPVGAAAPCAVVERFSGNIQLLSAERTRIREIELKAPVDCGGWVSVVDGFVHLRHRDGFLFGLSGSTIVRVEESNRPAVDPLQLVQGEVLVQAVANAGEVRILTPNARARVLRGRAVALYRETEQDSQLLVLSGLSRLENRFLRERSVEVRQGEFSSLAFKLLRTVPSAPAAFSQATLREKSVALHFDEAAAVDSSDRLRERQNRLFAAQPTMDAASRKPASSGGSYERHSADPADPALEQKFKRSLAGGSRVAEEILEPENHAPVLKNSRISVRAVESGKRSAEEESERARLLDELSRLKPGD